MPRSLECVEAVGGTAWMLSIIRDACFDGSRWSIRVTNPLHAWQRSAFQSAPTLARRGRCGRNGSVLGAAFLVDMRRVRGGQPVGIAHFAKRVLRAFGAVREGAPGLPPIRALAIPALRAEQIFDSPWISAVLRLAQPRGAALYTAERLSRERPCFAALVTSSRESTYFTTREAAHSFRLRAWRAASVKAPTHAHRKKTFCHFARARGRLEGGPRKVANEARVRAALARIAEDEGGALAVVSTNSSQPFSTQVRTFEACDVLVSVHGSHNANIMWMRAGALFAELNPRLFYYDAYAFLASRLRVRYVESRRNAIAWGSLRPGDHARARAFEARYGNASDEACQLVPRCRGLARGFPTLVDVDALDAALRRRLADPSPLPSLRPGASH